MGLAGIHYLKATTPDSHHTTTHLLHIFLLCTTSIMTASGNAWWESLPMEQKHQVTALAAAWQSHGE